MVVESGIEEGEGIDCWDVDGSDGVDGKDCLDGEGIDGLDDDGDWVDGLGEPLCDGGFGVEGRLVVDCDVHPKLSVSAVRATIEKRRRTHLWPMCSSFVRKL